MHGVRKKMNQMKILLPKRTKEEEDECEKNSLFYCDEIICTRLWLV